MTETSPTKLRTRAYLRASTADQDARRAEAALIKFADEHNLDIVSTYVENVSGASLERPELFRLLRDAKPGDIMLIEQVDRLSRLDDEDWGKLLAAIKERQVRIVSIDLPTSHMLMSGDEFTARIFGAINGMLLDMLAAISRKDYADRKRRQREGQERAKAAGRMGRPEEAKRHAGIEEALRRNEPWAKIASERNVSKATISKVAKRLRLADAAT